MTPRRVVITGAGGFLGSALVTGFAEMSAFEIVAVNRVRPAPATAAHSVSLELTDHRAVCAALRELQPDAIVHAAGRVRGSVSEVFAANTAVTAVLAEAIIESCPEALLTVLGSAAEYGLSQHGLPLRETAACMPRSPYGYSKHAAARYLADAAGRGLRYNLVRLFNPIGVENPADQVIGSFMQKAIVALATDTLQPILMGPLGGIRDYVIVSDVVDLIGRIVDSDLSGTTVNACSGEGRRVRDVIDRFIRVSGYDLTVVEDGPASDDPNDISIGDASLFKLLLGREELTSFDDTVALAWRHAATVSSPIL